MSNLLYLFRYFQVVLPIPLLMIHAFAVVTAVGILAAALGTDTTGAVVIPVIVLQAFSVSTGFVAPARRGYFDLLLARGELPARIALAQWCTAVVPGLCSWGFLAGAAAMAQGTVRTAVVAPGTMTVFLLVSTVPWAVTVGLPRFSGAIGWLTVVCLGAVGGVIWPLPLREVFFPLDLIGQSMAERQLVLVADVALSIGSVSAALAWVNWRDIPLEAAQ